MTKPAPGDQLPPLELSFDRAALVRYAGASGDFNEIHFSDAAAHAVGLPGVIAHGMLTMGAAIEAVVRWAGDPGAVLDYQVRFSRPIAVPDGESAALLVTGTVSDIDSAAGTATVALTVTCDGKRVLGKAQAVVRVA